MLNSLLLAAVLSEPLVVCQTQFYPTREQPRGYLGRYPDQPLLVDSDIPYDANRKGLRKRQFWGDYHSMADIDTMFAEGRSYGLDGFAFFPVAHRADLWRAQDSSVEGVALAPIINFTGMANASIEKDIVQLKLALANKRGPKVNGKTLILSYWCDRSNKPEELKAKLDKAHAEVGDGFVFMCATSWDRGNIEWRRTGRLSGATVGKLKAHFRDYLRVSDGILLDGTMANHAYENSTRVFAAAYHREVCRLARETVDEPEFRDRKLLGFTLSLGHQNAYHQSHTANAMGTRTLRESFENAIAAKPDVILIPEWDECNESTSWKPTLYNGYSTKRLYRYYDAVLRGRPQTTMAGDDTSVPNLIVSYRRLIAPGEWLYFEVVNVPDGSRDGTVECSLELTDAAGETICELPAKELREDALSTAWWDVSSEKLAERTRVVGVRLRWRKNFFRRGTIDEGLQPIDIAPANSWCLKDVKQPIRDLAPVTDCEFGWDGEKVRARVSCDEPIRHAMLVGNGWIQYIHNPSDPCTCFREDDAWAAFEVSSCAPKLVDIREKDFTYSVPGVPEAEWLCRKEVTAGETYRTDFIGLSSDPVYLRLPRAKLDDAKMKIDFRGRQDGNAVDFRGEVDLGKAFAEQAVSVGTTGCVEFAVARFALQSRYPSALNSREFAFEVKPDADRASMTYCLQLVTMDGKTWRSKPLVRERASGPVVTHVWSALKQAAVEVKLPRSRVPRLEYDFSPRAGDVVPVGSGERHFFGLAGAPQSLVTLWNRGSEATGCIDPRGGLFTAGCETHPRRERCADGEWALVFDGACTYVSLPHETLPQWAGSSVSLEVNPDAAGAARAETVLGSRRSNRSGVFDLVLDRGEPVVRCTSVDAVESTVATELRSGVKLTPGAWHRIGVCNDAATLTLTVDGKAVSKPLPMPGLFMNTTFLGGAEKNGTSFFTGKVRKLVIDHTVEKEN